MCEDEIQNSRRDNLKLSEALKYVAALLIVVFGIVGGFYFLHSYVVGVVEDRIKEPEFISKVAEEIRKSTAIFDQNESILIDDGAMKYIESIEVRIGDGNEPDRIVVSPNLHLQVAPLLESLDVDFYIEAKRGEKFDWVYTLGSIQRMVLESSADPPAQKRFRLEIIR